MLNDIFTLDRLGAFGWLSPPSEKTVVSNVGLHDARAALLWVQQYISKFGGHPGDVTVFGESAGGGVIMHTISAYGGEMDPPPFQKVNNRIACNLALSPKSSTL